VHKRPRKADINIKLIRGISVLLPVSKIPAIADSMEPRPIIIDPPKPEAVPANLGLIDNNPALAFGREIPLPNPTKVIVPKKLHSEPNPRILTASDNTMPDTFMSIPIDIMESIPT
jgi:hypothetical protein